MVVADAHEGEMRARVLDVGIADVGLIDHAVTSERGRDVKIAHLARVRDLADVKDGTVVAVRHLIGILNHLVDEITKVQHEAKPLIRGRALILPDHAAVGILRTLIDALARDKGEADRARIIVGRRGDGHHHGHPVGHGFS